MGFQYAAKRVSSASDRSAASLLRAAATTERRVTGKDSPPGALMARESLPYSQTVPVAARFSKWQVRARERVRREKLADYAGTAPSAFCAASIPLLIVDSQSRCGTGDFAAA